MKYQFLATGAALAPLAAAGNVHRRDYGFKHNHNDHNDIVYVTQIEVVTVIDTVFAPAPPAATDAGPVPVAEPTSVVADTTSVVVAETTTSAVAATTPASSPSTISSAVSITTAAASSPIAATSVVSVPAANKVATSASSSAAKAQDTTTAEASTTAAVKSTQAATSSSTSSDKNMTTSNLSPQGKKAGLSGYVSIQNTDAFDTLAPYISWYSDYTANTPSSGNVTGVGMLWAAAGSGCGSEVTNRVNAFDALVTDSTPEIMFGFYEPDCYCPDSAAMSTSQGQAAWNSMIAPLKSKGTILGSPSMCKQKDETWLTPFKSNIDVEWDVTSVHINKPNITGVKQDIEYYASTYGKPIWVSEFACVNDHDTWSPCTDQTQINQFINDCVAFFEGNDTVVAYGPSNGNGLGKAWPLTNQNGGLSESGTTYLNAIKGH